MATQTYEYENGLRIVIDPSIPQKDFAKQGEVRIGLTTLYVGTPYGCICFAARRGSKKAAAQLREWQRREHGKKPGKIITL